MYIPFKILTVEPIIGEQAILIEASHEIDSQSIRPENIRITRPLDPIEELIWYDYEVNGKIIKLFLKEQPRINERYIVRIRELINIIDDTLKTEFSQSIVFTSFTRSSIAFVKPIMHSIIQTLTVEIEEQLFENETIGANYFEYELSTDPLFLSNMLPVDTQQTTEKQITFNLMDHEGQIFVRCRAFYIGKLNAEGVLDESVHHSDWINTTCVINSNHLANESYQPSIQLALDVTELPLDDSNEKDFSYVFDTEMLDSVGDVIVTATSLLDNTKTHVFVQRILFNNTLIITPLAPLPTNSLITVVLKDIKAGIRSLVTYSHSFYSILENCYADLKDIRALIDSSIILDHNVVYYHLLEASKLADYYVAINVKGKLNNLKYYHQVEDAYEFEKNMFVKYYAANQILSQIRSRIAFEASMSGKLGEIEYTPKGSLPDIAAVLSSFIEEANKWKLALQGHKDYPPGARGILKAKKYMPYGHNRGGR